MKKYRKRPLEVYAVKWAGLDIRQIGSLLGKSNINRGEVYMGHAPGDGNLYELEIKTLEGIMTAEIGDYIICGIKGELYPCKPDIFEASYDEVPE